MPSDVSKTPRREREERTVFCRDRIDAKPYIACKASLYANLCLPRQDKSQAVFAKSQPLFPKSQQLLPKSQQVLA
ncbi:hypothetical protein [Prochlorococcus marinus]|uniref:hypothetical protein n=1 Tax=Prochlorococcus TaxID=1218 RepID=UPI0007B382F0|nr:hypothetical protein [Prochlorococcus marinus]KZR77560.1 hypothetical protein PMIT1323_00937 [Prochlorococcus marinus str. MIT 1323]